MPLAGQAGFSDNTPLKQEHFGLIMHTLAPIIASILRRGMAWVHPQMLYIDLNAGPGWYPNFLDLFQHGLLGSPLLTLQASRAAQIPLQGYLIDSDPQAMASLCQMLPLYGGLVRQGVTTPAVFATPDGRERLVLCPGASATYLARLTQMAREAEHALYGVIYSDVNGGSVPFDELAAYSQVLPYVDCVVHLSATHRKRVHGRYHTRPPLAEAIQAVKKKFWIVRKPARREQWTFLIGTNWDSFPKFERQGFVRTETSLGQEILHRLSYPQEKSDE